MMTKPRAGASTLIAPPIWMGVFALAIACASVKSGEPTGSGTGSGASGGTGLSGGGTPTGTGGTGLSGGPPIHRGDCVNLECTQTTCLATKCDIPACGELEGSETTLEGTVYDPAGRTPLYNVAVYVPNAPLEAVPEGLSCTTCDGRASGKPIASALTDASGKFHLTNPPTGTNIPLVLQVGKWRREITIPSIGRCKNNVVDDPELLRLPRNQAEGHIPLIALSTGHSDALDCLLRKIGIADSEFTNDAGTGRVHMYFGANGVVASDHGTGANQLVSGARFASSYQALLPVYDKLASYDILILQCEGQQPVPADFPAAAANLRRYADSGGRVFAEHVHSSWIRVGLPPWPATATWIGSGTDLPPLTTGTINTSFPKGAALAEWLVAVGASGMMGQIPIMGGQNSVNAVSAPTQPWITAPDFAGSATTTQYLTFNTPAEAAAENQCGRMVFTDVHVASGSSSHPETPFPNGCGATLTTTPQEKALEFMFFDLSSCVQIDTRPPKPPIVVP